MNFTATQTDVFESTCNRRNLRTFGTPKIIKADVFSKIKIHVRTIMNNKKIKVKECFFIKQKCSFCEKNLRRVAAAQSVKKADYDKNSLFYWSTSGTAEGRFDSSMPSKFLLFLFFYAQNFSCFVDSGTNNAHKIKSARYRF